MERRGGAIYRRPKGPAQRQFEQWAGTHSGLLAAKKSSETRLSTVRPSGFLTRKLV